MAKVKQSGYVSSNLITENIELPQIPSVFLQWDLPRFLPIISEGWLCHSPKTVIGCYFCPLFYLVDVT